MLCTKLMMSMLLLSGVAVAATSSPPQDNPGALMGAERTAMAPLSKLMTGTWRGKASFTSPTGKPYTMDQTERVRSMLGGTLLVMEGRGQAAGGRNEFGALGVVSYDPGTHAYDMRAYAQGRAGDFTLTPTADGFAWSIPAGPMTIRYTATVHDGVWHETGERVTKGGPATRFFEMTLHRVGGDA